MGQLFYNKGIEGVLHARDLCLPFVHIHVLVNTPQFKWWWQLISVELQTYRSLTSSNEFHLVRTKKGGKEKKKRERERETWCGGGGGVSYPTQFIDFFFSFFCCSTESLNNSSIALIMISDKSLIKQLWSQ